MTRRQLADIVGISYQHLYNLERGWHGASEKVIVPIAHALGLTLDQAADREPKSDPGRGANPTTAPEPTRPIPPPRPTKPPTKASSHASAA